MIAIGCLAATAIVLLLYLLKILKEIIYTNIQLAKLPGPKPRFFILGALIDLPTDPVQMFTRLREFAREYRSTYLIRAGWLCAANVITAEDVEKILSNPVHMQKSIAYWLLHDWLGTGLLTSSGEKWKHRRRILTPAFHFNILQGFISIFNTQTAKLVENFKIECNKPFVNIGDHLAQFTLHTIAETSMGVKFSPNTAEEIAYKTSIHKLTKILLYRFVHSWLVFKPLFMFTFKYVESRRLIKTLHQFTKNVIAEREKNFTEIKIDQGEHDVYSGKKKLAMLDLMLTSKITEGEIDDKGINEEVGTLMFGGHDTTAVALGYLLMAIANHEDVQLKIFEEMKDVLGNVLKAPNYQELQNMKYLECVIKETLRMYPSVHFISRKLGRDVITSSGKLLPKGSIVHIHIYDIHHDPKHYPEPEKFDPDRFLPEQSQNRHPFAFVPFSGGLRNCMGQKFAMLEIKAAVCGVLANFVLRPVDTPSTVTLSADIVLRAKDDIKVRFEPRK